MPRVLRESVAVDSVAVVWRVWQVLLRIRIHRLHPAPARLLDFAGAFAVSPASAFEVAAGVWAGLLSAAAVWVAVVDVRPPALSLAFRARQERRSQLLQQVKWAPISESQADRLRTGMECQVLLRVFPQEPRSTRVNQALSAPARAYVRDV